MLLMSIYEEHHKRSNSTVGWVTADYCLNQDGQDFQIFRIIEASAAGLFSFRLFVHFRRKVAIRRSLGQGKVLD